MSDREYTCEEVLKIISDDLTDVASWWNALRDLYADREFVAAANRHAPTFFWHLQRRIGETVILPLSRLADKAADHKGNRNLSFDFLARQLPDADDELPKALRDYESLTGDLRTHRNKWLAHRDEQTHRSQSLPPVARKQINAVIEAATRIVSIASQRIGKPPLLESVAVNDWSVGEVKSLVWAADVVDWLQQALDGSSSTAVDIDMLRRVLIYHEPLPGDPKF